MKRIIKLFLLLSLIITTCLSCAGMIHSIKLPIIVHIIDAESNLPVSGAIVELQWRSGFQGYYWGKPVKKVTNKSGIVVFEVSDVQPVSADGYDLGGKITKLFISTILAHADGYKTTILEHPRKMNEIFLLLEKGKRNDIYKMTN